MDTGRILDRKNIPNKYIQFQHPYNYISKLQGEDDDRLCQFFYVYSHMYIPK